MLQNLYQSLKQNGVLVIEVLGKERLARVWKDTMCTNSRTEHSSSSAHKFVMTGRAYTRNGRW